MANSSFSFKQFTVQQGQSAMKVTTDGCLFGAWVAREISQLIVHPGHCLDIGTGTGLLSLMIAQQNPDWHVEAVEIDKEAAEEAGRNCKAAGRQNQIRVIHQDILQYQPEKKFDILFSNPPFYEKELKGDDPKRNRAHHNDGLLLTDLFKHCKNLLREQGRLYLLLPYKREKEILQLLADAGYGIVQHIRVRPAERLEYFRILLELRLKEDCTAAALTGEMAVKDDKDQYTEEFRKLLKDYYLYL